MSKSMLNAMFGDSDSDHIRKDVSDDDWALPHLKAVQQGKAINASLASLVNTACTSACKEDKKQKKERTNRWTKCIKKTQLQLNKKNGETPVCTSLTEPNIPQFYHTQNHI